MKKQAESREERERKARELAYRDRQRMVGVVAGELAGKVTLVKDKDWSESGLGTQYDVMLDDKRIGTVTRQSEGKRWKTQLDRKALPKNAGYQRSSRFMYHSRKDAVADVCRSFAVRAGIVDERIAEASRPKRATPVNPPKEFGKHETFKVLLDEVLERDGFTFRRRAVTNGKVLAWRVIVDDRKVVGRKRTVEGHRLVAEGTATSAPKAKEFTTKAITDWLANRAAEPQPKPVPAVKAPDVDVAPKPKPSAGGRKKRYGDYDTLDALKVVGGGLAHSIMTEDTTAAEDGKTIAYPDEVGDGEREMLEYRLQLCFDDLVREAGEALEARRAGVLEAKGDEDKVMGVMLRHPMSLGAQVCYDIQVMMDEGRRNGAKYWNKMKRAAAASLRDIGHELGQHRG